MQRKPSLSEDIKDFISSQTLEPEKAKELEWYLRSACTRIQELCNGALPYNASLDKDTKENIISGGKKFLRGLSSYQATYGSNQAIKTAQALVESIMTLTKTVPLRKRGRKNNYGLAELTFFIKTGYNRAFDEPATVVNNTHSNLHKKSRFHKFFEDFIKVIVGAPIDIKASTLQDYITACNAVNNEFSIEAKTPEDTEHDSSQYRGDIELPVIDEKRPEGGEKLFKS